MERRMSCKMIIDKELRDINDRVYYVDPEYSRNKKVVVSKENSKLKKNEENIIKAGNRKFKVLATLDDAKGTGFQGMAVAPITPAYPNGDPTQVVVAAAGTDPTWRTRNDVINAIKQIPGFNSSQLAVADQFVQSVQKKYPVAQLTGYSQGAYVLKVGAKYGIPTTVFNGWFRYDKLSKEEADFMGKHPTWFRNYRRKDDEVVQYLDGNMPDCWYGDHGEKHEIPTYHTIYWADGTSHSLDAWKFDKNGNLKEIKQTKADQEQLIQQSMRTQLKSLNVLRNKFTKNGGHLSKNEELFLESSEALAAAQGFRALVQLEVTELIAELKKGVQEAEEVWQDAHNCSLGIGEHLHDSEILEALGNGGANTETIVYFPTAFYEGKIQFVQQLASSYEQTIQEISAAIQQLLETDQKLAREVM